MAADPCPPDSSVCRLDLWANKLLEASYSSLEEFRLVEAPDGWDSVWEVNVPILFLSRSRSLSFFQPLPDTKPKLTFEIIRENLLSLLFFLELFLEDFILDFSTAILLALFFLLSIWLLLSWFVC